MDAISLLIGLAAGAAAGGAALWAIARARHRGEVEQALAAQKTELALAQDRLAQAATAAETLRAEKRAAETRAAEAARAAEELKSALARAEERAQQTETRLQEAQEQARAQAAAWQKRLDEAAAALQGERERADALAGQAAELEKQLSEQAARAEERRKSLEEQLRRLEEAEKRLSETFRAASAEALRSNNQQFLELARETFGKQFTEARGDLEKREQAIAGLVQPISQTLSEYEKRVREIEEARKQAYGAITQQVASLAESQRRLQSETANLVQALRAPQTRGRWGEVQLRRVVEMAGMVAYCDFEEQPSADTEEGRRRPDLIVKLPGGKRIVVDAKAPLKAYLESLEAPEGPAREAKLREHVSQLRAHIKGLSAKAYWEQFQPAPEFAVLFLPGENFFRAALESDPALLEDAVTDRVILATPVTLISLLKVVAYGWRQERIAEEAEEISRLGRDLYSRISTLAEHFVKLRNSLENSVKFYNQAVASLESRVLPQARKFQALGAAGESRGEIPLLEPLDSAPRQLQAPEFTPPPGET